MGSFKERARRIKAAAFDIDGVMTDGSIVISETGELCKSFNSKDGYGLKALMECGIQVAVITGRKSGIVERRMAELGVKTVIQASADKGATIRELAKSLGIGVSECAFMGDDIPDLPALLLAGVSFAPADAVPEVLESVDEATRAKGGRGAVREACERLLKARGQWKDLVLRRCGVAPASGRDGRK